MSENKDYDKDNLTCLFTEKDWDVWQKLQDRATEKEKNSPYHRRCPKCGAWISNPDHEKHCRKRKPKALKTE